MPVNATALWHTWCTENRYFDDLAVFSLGPLHPGGFAATKDLICSRAWKGCKVLDIGCGNGTTMRLLSQQGAQVLGVEPSPFMREAAWQMGIDRSCIIPQSIESLSLAGTFDAIILEGVIGFVRDPVTQLRQLIKILRPSGDLFVSDWEPHDRPSLPEYGFIVKNRVAPEELSLALQGERVTCRITRRPAVAHAFNLDVAEAMRRAAVFFPDASDEALQETVRRKVNLMQCALPNEFRCARFLLRATLVTVCDAR